MNRELKYKVRVKAFDAKVGRPQWCKNNVGIESLDWDYIPVNGIILEYVFVREEDAMMFALKWL